MPANVSRPDILVDTSVAVALVVADHAHHESVVKALGRRRLGLAGHAAFETFSVLTRLPSPVRLTASAAARLLSANFPGSRFLGADAAADLFTSMRANGISGGSVYDALVGAVAQEHGVVLGTRDRRAVQTYRALSVDYELIPDVG